VRAEAEAEAIRLEGDAKAAAIEAEAEALTKNQEAFLAQRALDALVPMMTEFAKGYANVGNITVLSGSGSEGASSHLAGETAIGMRTMFDSVQAATGLDLAAVLQGHAIGRGVAAGQHDAAGKQAAPAPSPSEGTSVDAELPLNDPSSPTDPPASEAPNAS
jgi:flotillin